MSRLEAQCVEHITIYHKRITKSRGIRNDEDSTTGPQLRQRRDLPIFKTSPESSSSARTAPTSPTTAERQKAILTTTAQRAQSETKITPKSTDWKAYASTVRKSRLARVFGRAAAGCLWMPQYKRAAALLVLLGTGRRWLHQTRGDIFLSGIPRLESGRHTQEVARENS
ncbi:hypothetical protein CABS02_15119 [Colletotrichum abscissum]|uniref:Uncharacterized protein n=1 Tax=Colletotrichum abscissum TaxID=1671311 RepID=A0A9P9X009_9PEZI|nr:hypothetical protein CABS02_15119 [Colletotrichum abscissum]